MVKRSVGLLFILVGLLAASPAVAAAVGSSGIYVGADAVLDGLSYHGGQVSRAPSVMYGGEGYIGYQIAGGVSAEVGYLYLGAASSALKTTTRGLTADGVLRVPVFDWLDLDGKLGVSYLSTNAAADLFPIKSAAWGWRVEAGPEITVIPGVGWRTLVGYQQTGLTAITSGDVTVSTGLAVHF